MTSNFIYNTIELAKELKLLGIITTVDSPGYIRKESSNLPESSLKVDSLNAFKNNSNNTQLISYLIEF